MRALSFASSTVQSIKVMAKSTAPPFASPNYRNSNQRQYLFQYNKFAPTPFRMRVRQVRGKQKNGVQCGSGPSNTSADASAKRTCTSNLMFDGNAPNTDWHGGSLKGLPAKCQNPLSTDIYDRTKPIPFAFQYNTTTELNPRWVQVVKEWLRVYDVPSLAVPISSIS